MAFTFEPILNTAFPCHTAGPIVDMDGNAAGDIDVDNDDFGAGLMNDHCLGPWMQFKKDHT